MGHKFPPNCLEQALRNNWPLNKEFFDNNITVENNTFLIKGQEYCRVKVAAL